MYSGQQQENIPPGTWFFGFQGCTKQHWVRRVATNNLPLPLEKEHDAGYFFLLLRLALEKYSSIIFFCNWIFNSNIRLQMCCS